MRDLHERTLALLLRAERSNKLHVALQAVAQAPRQSRIAGATRWHAGPAAAAHRYDYCQRRVRGQRAVTASH
jgi:hypothetical protein